MPNIRPARPDELGTLTAIDDDASQLYVDAGLPFVFNENSPFLVAESRRWAQAIDQELAHVAADSQDEPVGFIVLGSVDGAPYLDQIAVRPRAMRRGIGTALLQHAIALSGEQPLWLTTYAHQPWNQPYYERHGFVVVPETGWGPELLAVIQEQRVALPDPDERIAMVRTPGANQTPTA